MEGIARGVRQRQHGTQNISKWLAAGSFEKVWAKGLEKYGEMEGVGWAWKRLDGRMAKASLALESVGKNPPDRGENGDKTQWSDR